MSLDTSCAIIRDLKKKEKKKGIAIAGRFAFLQQQRTTLTKMVHNRGLVPARQGTRQGFYRGPKSLPLSRVETPK